MVFSLLSIRGAGPTNCQKKRSCNREKSTSSGPSPSLWPEPTHTLPIAAHRAQSNTAAVIPSAVDPVIEGSDDKHEEGVHTKSAVFSPDSVRSQVGGSGSTFPVSDSTTASSPPPRPIDINGTNVFESHYPAWYSYPPILPTTFETGTISTFRPVKDESFYFNLTDIFLERSRAFQDWVEKKNASRIKLRHQADYEKLVDELHKYQRLAGQGPTPAVRTDAKQQLLRIKEEMVEERKTFSAAELQHIRDIEKAWVPFVSIGKYEQEISRHRHMSALPRAEPKRTLSKVERLLGSDGSSLGVLTMNRPPPVESQLDRHAMSWDEPSIQSMDLHGRDPKERAADIWPDKPYEILIPDWFPVAEAQGNIECNGATMEARFKNLNNFIHDLESAKSQLEYQEKHPDEEGVVKDYTWDKHWHQPNPGWRHEHQRQKGGLWKCRKGPDATGAENRCRLCSNAEEPEAVHPAKVLDDVMKYIREAMAEVAEKDKKEVIERTALKNGKPTSQVESQRQEALHDDTCTTSKHETISFGARQSYINYNPLTGLDDSPKAMAKARSHSQAQQMAAQEQGQGKLDDNKTNKN
ncbi:hypothetical protein HD806DRAFT_306314 [Xylariaceae sp. AK1471]|nr:hypothetical protein HD806DRAFT_306314 [Xylariaceae sp. AK1471]